MAWHYEATQQVFQQRPKQGIKQCTVEITFFAPDARKADLSNKAESLMDLLVDTKILEDDNWFVVKKLTLIFGGIDKKNPRAEIEITT